MRWFCTCREQAGIIAGQSSLSLRCYQMRDVFRHTIPAQKKRRARYIFERDVKNNMRALPLVVRQRQEPRFMKNKGVFSRFYCTSRSRVYAISVTGHVLI